MIVNVEAFRNLERLVAEAGKTLAASRLKKPLEAVEAVRLVGISADSFSCRAAFSALVAGHPYTFEIPCSPVSGTLENEQPTGCEWVRYY